MVEEAIPNALFFNPYIQAEKTATTDMIEFFTVGSNGHFRLW